MYHHIACVSQLATSCHCMPLRHRSQVVNLRKDRETILTRSQGDEGDAQKMRTLQRDNAQLHLKLKGVLSELEETRAQREHVGLQSENLSRLQAKQLAEHTATNKALEVTRLHLYHLFYHIFIL